MSSTAYRFRAFRITPDHEPGAEPGTFAMQRVVCEEAGPAATDVREAHDWAETHLKANPEHLTYRELVARPYRAEPRAWP